MRLRWFVLLGLMIVQACTPDHNWREVSTPHYRVMLPGKAANLSRDVVLGGAKLTLVMNGAKALQTSYTVAVADVGPGVDASKVLADMQAGMVKNIGGTVVQEASNASVGTVDGAGKAGQALLAKELVAKGQAPIDGKAQAVEMRAKFISQGGRVLQAVAMGPSLDAEQTKTFFDSLRVIVTKP